MTDKLHVVEDQTFTMEEVLSLIDARDIEMERRRNGVVELRMPSDDEWVVCSIPDPTGVMSYVVDAINVLGCGDGCEAVKEAFDLLYDAVAIYMRHSPDVTHRYEPYEDLNDDGE